MFWAVNDPKVASNGKTVGENSIALADYAAALDGVVVTTTEAAGGPSCADKTKKKCKKDPACEYEKGECRDAPQQADPCAAAVDGKTGAKAKDACKEVKGCSYKKKACTPCDSNTSKKACKKHKKSCEWKKKNDKCEAKGGDTGGLTGGDNDFTEDCKDSTTWSFENPKDKELTCYEVARNPARRCGLPGAAAACKQTCGAC